MKNITALLLVLFSNFTMAQWLTVSGPVKRIVTYAHTETILVEVSDEDVGAGTCSNKKTFAISSTMSEEGRARMYAMLLSAQATGREVLVSYLDDGGCEAWFGAHDVYRRITVLR